MGRMSSSMGFRDGIFATAHVVSSLLIHCPHLPFFSYLQLKSQAFITFVTRTGRSGELTVSYQKHEIEEHTDSFSNLSTIVKERGS